MNFTEIKELIGVLSPFILAILGFIFNRKLNKQKKDAEDVEKKRLKAEAGKEEIRKKEEVERKEWLKNFMSNTIDDISVKVTNMEMLLSHHIEDTDFRAEFKDTIRNRVRQNLVTLSSFLDQEYKNILSNWGDSIEKFGLDWYYNIRRNREGEKRKRKDIDGYLTQEMDIMIRNFDNYVDFASEQIRVFKKNKVVFSKFLEQTKIHTKTELLKLRLIENGFTDSKEIFETFREYIDVFFKEFTSILTIWDRLDVFEYSKESA